MGAGGTRLGEPINKHYIPLKWTNSYGKPGGQSRTRKGEAVTSQGGARTGLPLSFWVGETASQVGSHILNLAYPLLALALTKSPVQAGWVAFALTVPGLLCYLPAGILADRVDPRSLMLVSEILRAAAVASVVAALLLDVATVPHLLAAAALEGTLGVLYSLAENALIPSVAGGDTELPDAVARSERSSHLAVLTGRLLGGLLYGLQQAIPFAMNALLFTASLTSILRMRGRKSGSGRVETAGKKPERPPTGNPLRAIADGLRELGRHKFLLQAVPVTAVTNVVVSALIMIFIATSDDLAAWEVGLVLAAGGMGGLLGSWFFLSLKLSLKERLTRRLASSPRLILAIQAWVWMIALAIATFGPRPVNFGLATFATGCAGAMSNITLRLFEGQRVERATLARVTSISRLVSRGATALAAPLGGMLVAVMNTDSAILSLLAVTVGLAVTVTVWRPAEITIARWRRRSRTRGESRRAEPPAVRPELSSAGGLSSLSSLPATSVSPSLTLGSIPCDR